MWLDRTDGISWTEPTDLASHLHLNLSHSLTNHNHAVHTWIRRQLTSPLANTMGVFLLFVYLHAVIVTSLNSTVVVMVYLYFFLREMEYIYLVQKQYSEYITSYNHVDVWTDLDPRSRVHRLTTWCREHYCILSVLNHLNFLELSLDKLF
jgi:hypothetical protein